jgi:energy-coupling factor transport system ATP-binding protein
VWAAGRNTKTHAVAELAAGVGMVFQDPESQLFNMSVEDEVAFGPESLGLPAAEIEGRTRWALEAVGLAELGARSPAHLSGGEQRRLAIAAALAMRPDILVLDEPTAGLDPLGRRAILAVISGLRRRGTTVILAGQDAEAAAELADQVVVLAEGRIVWQGTPREVFGQVERLHALGVDAPQMAELSGRLGVRPPWLTLEEAAQALAGASLSHPVRPSPAAGPRGTPAVEFQDVWFRYEAGVQALAGIDLALGAGEFAALVGANGSGKTTLAKHANGLLRPERGRVLVHGQDTRTRSTGELARRVGYVFQNPDHQIFAPTVRDEIAFGPRNLGLDRGEVERRVAEALAVFDLAPLAGLPPATLGYGQRRLVALSAVHAMQPGVLVLDEPTVGLDRRLTHRLMAWAAERHAAGAAVLLITHDMRLAGLAPRCIAMAGGRIILDAPTSEAFAQPERLAGAGLEPPPLVELARRLGMPAAPLSVYDLAAALAPQTGEVGRP